MASELRAVVTELLEEPGGADGPRIASPEAATRRTDGCKAARAALVDARASRKNWEKLLLLVGIAIAITLGYLILQLTDLVAPIDKIKAAGGAGATLVSGRMGTWILKRRNEANIEVREWADLVNERCE